MHMTNCISARGYHDLVICPACGESDYKDCHFDADLRRELLREADSLVQEGCYGDATDLLIEVYARDIVDRVKPRWRCVACGVMFRG